MRFGVIKTLVENKLIKSFVDKKLVKDMKLFESKILKDKSFARLYFIYDTLKENKSLDKETAIYMIDDLVSESKNLKISDKTMEEIVKWTRGLVKENNYTIIDNLIYGDELKPEKKSYIDWGLETEYASSEHRDNYKIKLHDVKARTVYGSDLFIF